MNKRWGHKLLGGFIIIVILLGALIPCKEVFAYSDVGVTYRSHVQNID